MQIAKHEMNFEQAAFALQILAKGSYIDAGCSPRKLYQVEAITIRLNAGAFNTWLLNREAPDRECYETAKEWETAKLEKTKAFESWTKDVISALDLDGFEGSVHISQADAEVFTVVHIWSLTPEIQE